ncbi:hypothetical protein B0X71_10430 [Planococcus lenghuensis]|uniref:Glycosyltransferase RgtA/B/C/D-like domain-containing protein n=2 Tax=Planococcus lenghuensis TaxID=2213202 RepID=A0A1Q2L3X8_9BACL|nr:hypothetical protein B0X71_10430 [Planococcus lenghuensis]
MASFAFGVLLLGLLTVFRLVYSSTYARSWDHVDFALALDRYDLMAMQPHFPGYPYFIFGGTLVHEWIGDPVQALAVFNAIMLLLAALPIYWIARRRLAPLESLTTCLAVESLGYLSVMGTEAMSEATAVSVLFWYLWSLVWAYEKKGTPSQLLPIILFSVLLGVRLSYLPFGLGLLLLFFATRKRFQTTGRFLGYLAGQCLLVFLFQLVWISALIVSEGSMVTFISLSLQFVNGHFNEWGGAVTAESTPIISRAATLLFTNILWVGISGGSWIGASGMGVLFFYASWLLIKRRSGLSKLAIFAMVLWLSYFFWALFAQNIDKPRHALPLAVMAVFLLSIFVLKRETRKFGRLLLLTIIAIQFLISYDLMQEKAEEVPAVYQLAEYLTDYPDPFIIYTWEEARVFDYLGVPYLYRQVETFEVFASMNSIGPKRNLFLTDHVVEGFRNQGVTLSGNLEKVKSFKSNPLFEPVYDEIVLYEWVNN